MSCSLVRKSLAIVDEQNKDVVKKCKRSPSLKVPPNHKLLNFKGKSKLTIGEARKQLLKSQKTVLATNLKKLANIKKIEKIQLDEKLKKQIIERAVTRRPIKPTKKVKTEQKSAFTEEDFKKFESEYFE